MCRWLRKVDLNLQLPLSPKIQLRRCRGQRSLHTLRTQCWMIIWCCWQLVGCRKGITCTAFWNASRQCPAKMSSIAVRGVTPQGRPGDSNDDRSPGSVHSGEKSSDDSCTRRGEGTDQLQTPVKSIASLVCEYIFKVRTIICLTLFSRWFGCHVFLRADGMEWGDSISVIVENSLSRDIALQKMVEPAEHCFRCLVLQGNEAAKEFLSHSHFLTKIVQSLSKPENWALNKMKLSQWLCRAM